MNPFKRTIFFLVILLSFFSGIPIMAADLKIITPYWGTEENTYQDNRYGVKLNGSQTMKGLYFQSINPEKYQWNLFIYQTENINYADLAGINFIYDGYYGKNNASKNVLGVGINYLQLDMAGKGIPTSMGVLNSFNLDEDTSSLFLRMGKYCYHNQTYCNWSLMPWLGGEWDHSEGDGLVNPGHGVGATTFKVNEDDYYWIAGLNLKADIDHFLQVEAKHTITFNHDNFFHKNTAMVNFFLNQNWGLSYRYNYQETAAGNDSYNIFGLAVLF